MEEKKDWLIKANKAMDWLFTQMGLTKDPFALVNLKNIANRLEAMINYAVADMAKFK